MAQCKQLIDLIDQALANRPTRFDLGIEAYGLSKKDLPHWCGPGLDRAYTPGQIEARGAALLAWLRQWVKPIFEALAENGEAADIVVVNLKPAPPEVAESPDTLPEGVTRVRWESAYDGPAEHLWSLWYRWEEIGGYGLSLGSRPAALPLPPAYPGIPAMPAHLTVTGYWFAQWLAKGLGHEGPPLGSLHAQEFLQSVVKSLLPDTDLAWDAPRWSEILCEDLKWLRRGVVALGGEAGEVTQASTNDGSSKSVTKPKRRKRIKREVAEAAILEHLMSRPHDTVEEVADAVGCSTGVVGESPAWRLNQKRLKIAKKERRDPKAIPLDIKAVTTAGGRRHTQQHVHEEAESAIDEAIDRREKDLFGQIGAYYREHREATPVEAAEEVGCTRADVERWQAEIGRLTREQAESELEDTDTEDPDAKRGKRRKWVDKQV